MVRREETVHDVKPHIQAHAVEVVVKLPDESLLVENPVHHTNALDCALLAREEDVGLTVPRVLGNEVKFIVHSGELDALDLVQLRLEEREEPIKGFLAVVDEVLDLHGWRRK